MTDQEILRFVHRRTKMNKNCDEIRQETMVSGISMNLEERIKKYIYTFKWSRSGESK